MKPSKERNQAIERFLEGAIASMPDEERALIQNVRFSLSEGLLALRPDPVIGIDEQCETTLQIIANKESIAAAIYERAQQCRIRIKNVCLYWGDLRVAEVMWRSPEEYLPSIPTMLHQMQFTFEGKKLVGLYFSL